MSYKNKINILSVEVIVGFFIFGILLALATLTIVLSKERLFVQTYPLSVQFEEVHGLRDGDRVLTRGVQVGRVSSLQVSGDGVMVHLSLERNLKMKEDYSIEIVASSVLGGQHVSVFPGKKDSTPLPEGTPLHGKPMVDLVKEASQAAAAIRTALVDDGILGNLKATMEQVNKITARLEKGEGAIGKLLTEDVVYEDIEKITKNLRDVTTRLNEGQGTLAKLLSDDATVYNDLKDITTNLKEVSERLSSGKGTLGKLLSEDDTFYDDLSKSAAAIRDVSETISKGEGTIGKLAKDEELYNEARLLMQELRGAVDDFRESAPIVTFSSVFFGAL